MEMQPRGNAIIAQIPLDANQLGFGNSRCRHCALPRDVPCALAKIAGSGEKAQQQSVSTLRDVFEVITTFGRVESGGRASRRSLVHNRTLGLLWRIFGVLFYLWFRFVMAFRHRTQVIRDPARSG